MATTCYKHALNMPITTHCPQCEIEKLRECLVWALEYIDAVPSDAAVSFPTMPGFDRDYVDNVLSGNAATFTE